ncbi:hypothetical protein QUB63_19735 [Microcoleus sp. ARI1-B5]
MPLYSGSQLSDVLAITNYQLPITNYPLPITHDQLPMTNWQSVPH